MIKIADENQLLSSFRTLDRDEVQIPSGLKFPLAVRDYFKWIEPSGHRVYLVFPDQETGTPTGLVFQRTKVSPENPAAMCQWCHAVRSGSGVSLLTVAASRNRRVGVYLCSDLECREHALSTPGIHDFNEGLSGAEKVYRILRRMTDFTRGNLF
jgi:hypothetical protein